MKIESVQSDTTNKYENLTLLEGSQQNQKLWPNLAHMCESYQVCDWARAAIANSAIQDDEIITPCDKLFVIDKNNLRQREKYRQEIRALNKTDFLNWSMACKLMADKMQIWF